MNEMGALSFDFADTLYPHRPRELSRILDGVTDYLAAHLPPFSLASFRAKFIEIRDQQFAENRATLRENDFTHRLRETISHVAGPESLTDALLRGCIDAYADAFVNVMEVPVWLPELFATLTARYRLCVVSNYPLSSPILRTLERDRITPFLSGIIVSADIGFIKPHPFLFDAALRALGDPPPDTVIHIGDDWDADIVGAACAGLRTIYTRQWRDVPDIHYGKGNSAPPIAEIDDLRALPDLLGRV